MTAVIRAEGLGVNKHPEEPLVGPQTYRVSFPHNQTSFLPFPWSPCSGRAQKTHLHTQVGDSRVQQPPPALQKTEALQQLHNLYHTRTSLLSPKKPPLSMSPMRNNLRLITNNRENETPAALTGISSCLAVLAGHQGRVKNMLGHPGLHPGAAAPCQGSASDAAFGAIPVENILYMSPPGLRLIIGTHQ